MSWFTASALVLYFMPLYFSKRFHQPHVLGYSGKYAPLQNSNFQKLHTTFLSLSLPLLSVTSPFYLSFPPFTLSHTPTHTKNKSPNLEAILCIVCVGVTESMTSVCVWSPESVSVRVCVHRYHTV